MQNKIIGLDSHFTYKKLFRFVASPILMMVFTSIYGVVDGFFISNFVGETQFAAANFVMPFIMIISGLGFMLGTGGTAIVSKTLGEGDKKQANNYFSFLVYVTMAVGVVVAVLGIIFTPMVVTALGANEEMLPYCVQYGRIVIACVPFFMLQVFFHTFCVTAERPKLGFTVTVISGVANMVLDALFMAVFKWGVKGAALATGTSQFLGAIIPIFYFVSKKNDSLLRLGKANFNGKVLIKTCTNGVSELVSNISGSIVSMVFNAKLMAIAGEKGVSCYGVMMYVNFIYIAIFIGYAIGTAPIIGFNYGAKNRTELNNLFKKSLVIMGGFGTLMTLLAYVLGGPISKIFVGYDQELCEMTTKAFHLFSLSFIFTGFGIFGSSMFTALGNGLISALISFLRTLVFQVSCVLILPQFLGINGVWLSMLAAEILATVVTTIFTIVYHKKYGYY